MILMHEDVDSIPAYIHVIEDARKCSGRAAMIITDNQVMAIASRSVLPSVDYDMECRQRNKLTTDQRTWFAWKTTFRDANYARI